MPYIVEMNENGVLQLPPELQDRLRPHTRYVVEVHGDVLILRPERRQPFWSAATPEERAEAFVKWVEAHPLGPGLPDGALRRDSLYD